MIDTTDPTPSANPSKEGPLRPPAWAEHSYLNVDSVAELATVVHTWTAPNPSEVAVAGHPAEACHVQVTQEVRVSTPLGSVQVIDGDPFIFLSSLDARFTSTGQARAFAANLLACCDRLDGAA